MFVKSIGPVRACVLALTLAALAATTASALETARMKLPAEFATAAERIPARGYGGANRGRYSIGVFQGDFVRIGSRFAIFDPAYASNHGKSSFTLEGPGLDGTVRAECRFSERVVTVGVVTFDARKLAYVCDIHGDDGLVGNLTVGQPKPEGLRARVLARADRRGVARIGSIQIDIESVHQYEGSKIGSQTAVGYVLSVSTGVVGALELTDVEPTFLLLRQAEPEIRQAALIAAVGLSVLRDPAESTLGD